MRSIRPATSWAVRALPVHWSDHQPAAVISTVLSQSILAPWQIPPQLSRRLNRTTTTYSHAYSKPKCTQRTQWDSAVRSARSLFSSSSRMHTQARIRRSHQIKPWRSRSTSEITRSARKWTEWHLSAWSELWTIETSSSNKWKIINSNLTWTTLKRDTTCSSRNKWSRTSTRRTTRGRKFVDCFCRITKTSSENKWATGHLKRCRTAACTRQIWFLTRHCSRMSIRSSPSLPRDHAENLSEQRQHTYFLNSCIISVQF